LILWEELRGFILAERDQVPQLRKIFIEWNNIIPAPPGWKELRSHAKEQGVDLIKLNSNNNQASSFRCERGWGMDGSIKWARCVEDLNVRDMPLVQHRKDIWKADYEIDPSQFFYKWHLCHEGQPGKRTYEPGTDDQTTDDEDSDDWKSIARRQTRRMINDQADEGYSDGE
jgi:hypothetical protein